MGWKDKIIGHYDYGSLCMPSCPWACFGRSCKAEDKEMHFFEKDEKLPLVVGLLMGLQHCFAMVGGLITPPYVVFKFALGFSDQSYTQYAISATLITSGICTGITVSQIPIPFSERLFNRRLVLGTGVLSVMGTSFTFLPIFQSSIGQMKLQYEADNGPGSITDDVLASIYGRMLGTVMVCCWVEVILSFVPVRVLKKVFNPLVTGITVMLIGAALVGTGMKYWGGGLTCADYVWSENASLDGVVPPPIPSNMQNCKNGFVEMGYGSIQYLGLGFSVLVALIFIEIFGSPFMKNTNVLLAVLFGYFIASIANHEGNAYVDMAKVDEAPWVTFLWTKTFPIGFYGPAVVPILVAFLVTTIETVGDLGATYEASELDMNGKKYEETVQGGLLADGTLTFLASLFTTMPTTTFAQNNGVISLTKCASKYTGYACAFWLFLIGVIGKIAGVIISIPDCVLGGMTIFLFANVFVSGAGLLLQCDLKSRRTRFIAAFSLAIGLGVTVFPSAFLDPRGSPYTANFWRCTDCSETTKGIRNAVSIILSTGYCIGAFCAILLDLVLPADGKVIDAETRQRRRAAHKSRGKRARVDTTARSGAADALQNVVEEDEAGQCENLDVVDDM